MAKRKPRTQSAKFAKVQERIEKWRKTRKKRGRMPEPLWKAAAVLAQKHGVNPVASALGLDYYSLKKRLPAVSRSGQHTAEFVEILPGGMPTARPECMIEVEDASGAKMRIHLQGGNLPDVGALLGVFREGRP